MKVLSIQDIVSKKIFYLREQKIMISTHLAELYGVEVRALVQTVKRNIERFPKDFMFQLNNNEYMNLKSQFVISKRGGAHRALPYAFTEQGVAMLSSVLNSKRAIQVNIGIMRVFVNIRKLVAGDMEINSRLNSLEYNDKLQDRNIKMIFKVIHEPPDTKLLTPEKPFSNRKVVRDVISTCEGYIYWVDKYFSTVGLDLIAESINMASVRDIRILMSHDKADKNFTAMFKHLKQELQSNGVTCEFRLITDKKLNTIIHDRWIVSENQCYNLPSTDTVARGQYSEVKKTSNIPPFIEWWDKSK
ncbi:MAG: ORF6N domain-containing protein [Endomicrobiales bacterium]|nr:ORF6N domain-containing protein [Endomicrobiales bacterium]